MNVFRRHHLGSAFWGKQKVKGDHASISSLEQNFCHIPEKSSVPRAFTNPIHSQGLRIEVDVCDVRYSWDGEISLHGNLIIRIWRVTMRNFPTELEAPV